jgi:hypothetical protein
MANRRRSVWFSNLEHCVATPDHIVLSCLAQHERSGFLLCCSAKDLTVPRPAATLRGIGDTCKRKKCSSGAIPVPTTYINTHQSQNSNRDWSPRFRPEQVRVVEQPVALALRIVRKPGVFRAFRIDALVRIGAVERPEDSLVRTDEIPHARQRCRTTIVRQLSPGQPAGPLAGAGAADAARLHWCTILGAYQEARAVSLANTAPLCEFSGGNDNWRQTRGKQTDNWKQQGLFCAPWLELGRPMSD